MNIFLKVTLPCGLLFLIFFCRCSLRNRPADCGFGGRQELGSIQANIAVIILQQNFPLENKPHINTMIVMMLVDCNTVRNTHLSILCNKCVQLFYDKFV